MATRGKCIDIELFLQAFGEVITMFAGNAELYTFSPLEAVVKPSQEQVEQGTR